MRQIPKIPLILAMLLLPATAQAACYADYKAKQDSPLRLHYGIVRIGNASACPDIPTAAQQVAKRLDGTGWTLLNVIQVSTDTPSAKQKANAGEFYLRF